MPDGEDGPSKLMPLAEAIRSFVQAGMQLCFASTPSRSNAAIRELCRQFRGRKPEFTLATTGFHSSAHLLGLQRLGRRYIGCFFGDNYPTPRANRLYAELLKEGYELEHWSLWSYVSALAAGAFRAPVCRHALALRHFARRGAGRSRQAGRAAGSARARAAHRAGARPVARHHLRARAAGRCAGQRRLLAALR
jgi:hypothetical protein